MFKYAIKQELFEYNPMQRVDRPTVKRYPASFYSVEEVQTLLAFAKDDPLYIPIVLAVYCGMRRSEALGMTWDCVDFENDKISVQKKVIEISKNGKKQIIVSDELKTESSRRVFAMHPDELSVYRVAKIIGYSERTIRRHIAKGRLFVTLKENKYLVSKYSLIKFLASR